MPSPRDTRIAQEQPSRQLELEDIRSATLDPGFTSRCLSWLGFAEGSPQLEGGRRCHVNSEGKKCGRLRSRFRVSLLCYLSTGDLIFGGLLLWCIVKG